MARAWYNPLGWLSSKKEFANDDEKITYAAQLFNKTNELHVRTLRIEIERKDYLLKLQKRPKEQKFWNGKLRDLQREERSVRLQLKNTQREFNGFPYEIRNKAVPRAKQLR